MSVSSKQRPFAEFTRQVRSITVASAFFLCLLFSSSLAYAQEVVVVVNKGKISSSPISRYVLSAIFGMRLTTWPDGTAFKVFVLSEENPVHSLFCKQVLHVFPHQLRTAWDRLVYSGTGQSPEILGSEKEMRALIANTPGAIGYLTKEKVDDSVAILLVE